jgi:hypothetical protein
MRALRADKSVTNYLTTRRAIALIEQAGLQVDAVIGMGFVTEKLYGIIPSAAIWRIESMLAGAPLLQRLAVNQMYFCRRLA